MHFFSILEIIFVFIVLWLLHENKSNISLKLGYFKNSTIYFESVFFQIRVLQFHSGFE